MSIVGSQRNPKALLKAALLSCLAAEVFLPATTVAAQPPRHFGVRDSIEMTVFSRDPYMGKAEIEFSPDGRHISVLTKRGLLGSDQTESTIWMFDAETIRTAIERSQGVHPRLLVSMATFSTHDQVNPDPITNARWNKDGKGITFLGCNEKLGRHLFVVNVEDGHLEQLSLDGQDVTDFERAGDTLVYTTADPLSDSELYQSAGPSLPDIQIGTGLSLDALLYPNWEKLAFESRLQRVWQVRNGRASPVVDSTSGAPISLVNSWFGSLRAVSPSGRYLVIKNFVDQVPKTWESYEPAYNSVYTRIVADDPNKKPKFDTGRPQQYELIDLQTGILSPLINAPLGRSAGYNDAMIAAWSKDEREVALSNTFLSLDRRPFDRGLALKRPCVAVVEIATRKAECLKESPTVDLRQPAEQRPYLTDIRWHGDQQLVLRYSRYEGEDDLFLDVFERQKGLWKPINSSEAREAAAQMFFRSDLSISVHESVNEPPVLIATLPGSKKQWQVWDPNPQFVELNLGRASVYHWRDNAGHEWTGGLVQPPDFVAGHRYPLVIQTHGFESAEFLADGSYTTANAARALAGRGIIVLQVAEPSADWGTPLEPSADGRAGYVSAIDQLVAEGLVNPHKVGIIGFSHTGWYVP